MPSFERSCGRGCRRLWGCGLAGALVAAGCNPAGPESSPLSDESRPVVSLQTGERVAGSQSRLRRFPDQLEAAFHTSGLAEGHAVTLLWAVFNHPEACSVGNAVTGVKCGPPDLANAATGASVQVLGGWVIGADGVLFANDTLRVREVGRCTTPVPCREGLTDAAGAEVHLVVRDHGPALPDHLAAQLSSFNGGCPPNTCVNPQAAQFVPGLPGR